MDPSMSQTSVGVVRVLLESALEALASNQWFAAVQFAAQGLARAETLGFQLVALDVLAAGHVELGQPDEAARASLESLRLGSTDSVGSVVRAADLFRARGESARSLELLETAYGISPSTPELAMALAHAFHRGGSYPSAIKWYERLDELDPAGASARQTVVGGLRETVATNESMRRRLAGIGSRLSRLTGRRVVTGPFAGQILEMDHDFGWVATLLGCYELELHDVIEASIAARPSSVINIGCSGGYYAVGYARRIPSVRVVAYDIDEDARVACRRAAEANDVADRVDIRGSCDHRELESLVGPNSLVFADCEGYELHLLDPERVPALVTSTIIVELHDVWVEGLSHQLLRRFVPTHKIVRLGVVPRTADGLPILQTAGLSADEITLAISDFRVDSMTWAYMVPRTP